MWIAWGRGFAFDISRANSLHIHRITCLLLCFVVQVADLFTVAVGIGKKVDKTILREIAGEKGTVLAVEGFDQLAAELRTVKKQVCGKL